MKTASPLFLRILNDIKADIARQNNPFLPKAESLSRAYGVSKPTLLKVLAELRSQGLIDTGRGQKIRITSIPLPASPKKDLPSAVTLAREYRNLLLLGRLREGQAMPKVAYLSEAKNISPNTILKAYKQLAEENLIRKQGRIWLVGGIKVAKTRLSSLQKERYLILAISTLESWQHLHTPRTGAFCYSFSREADTRGVVLRPIPMSETPWPLRGHPAGLDGLSSEIGRLGKDCCGVLWAMSSTEMPTLEKGFQICEEHQIQHIWWDRYGEKQKFAIHPRRALCTFSEESAVTVATQTLTQLGHRTIAYFGPLPGIANDWAWSRAASLEKELKKQMPGVKLLPFAHPMQGTQQPRKEDWEEAFRQLLHKGPAPITRMLSRFSNDTGYSTLRPEISLASLAMAFWSPPFPGQAGEAYREAKRKSALLNACLYLGQVLHHEDVTAFVTCHDNVAALLYPALLGVGYRVPEEISVLSFDNDGVRGSPQVSSIDMGFGIQGFKAFHYLWDEIPVALDSKRVIPSAAYLNHWGTLRSMK